MGKKWGRLALVCLVLLAFSGGAAAQDSSPKPVLDPHKIVQDAKKPEKVTTTIEIVVLLTILTLAPSILVMLTSFTRIVIVLSFVRRALATQELPPNQVIIGLSLILTFLVMAPTFRAIKRDALDPYTSGDRAKQITQKEALRRGVGHFRTFMFRHARVKDIHLFMTITEQPKKPGGWTEADVPTETLVPAFVISELRRAFIMGFALFLPFMIIDMVVAATLISMGMLVLPPILISLPFKILLFILVDGWHLVVGSLVQSFY
ncbi:MAG: flagellar type III secretion system pore protein FliP [Planctomycetes bacterium]|nr:flagellar type III secretion system pore protein FliP [Planctomycetota bacterium]